MYRRAGQPRFTPDEIEGGALAQWQQVEAFFGEFHNPDGSIRGGVNVYETPEDFRAQLDQDVKRIVFRLVDTRQPGVSSHTGAAVPPPLWHGSPFPGLRAFTPDDAAIFFGRGRETDEVLRRLADPATRCLMVVGASGSDKSSLVAAGLLPRLMGNAIEGSKDWLLPHVASTGAGRRQWTGLCFTPGELGDNSFVALAAKLAPLLPDEGTIPRKVAEDLAIDPGRLAQLIEAALQSRPHWAEAVMFVDQFEELFSVVAQRYRAPFVEMLAAAARAPRLRTVITIRGDFYHHCLGWPALAETLRSASFPLAAPGSGALSEMINGPAARAGLMFDEGLPARIVDDTGNNPGSLALLAFALHELFDTRTPGRRLTHEAYEAFDGVRGAISRRAEDTFTRLPLVAQAQLEQVFRDLVEVDERGVATRRRMARAHFAAPAEAAKLVDDFTDARLLVTDRNSASEAVVEVAHEALLREWPRLQRWIADNAVNVRAWRQVEAAAAEWQQRGRDSRYLWLHERLVLVHQAREQLGIDLASLVEPVKSFVRPETERLLDELEKPDTTHYRRAAIGDRLDRINDPRRGVGLRGDGVPDIVWCEVPGGTVTLEKGAGTFQVDPFFIAKYPVTYCQYRAFLDGPKGYRDKRWWKGLKRARHPGEPYLPFGNCAAEDVSWYDAVAFCRWLSSRLGYEVRLPAEWEWQQAASGGTSNNEYPWGRRWVEGRANSDESRLGRATAVGMYPRGASAQKVLDLAGNVWEWCLNKHGKPNDVSPGGAAPRVQRGGSCTDSRDDSRCARRVKNDPDDRLGVGFRVVCLSPSS